MFKPSYGICKICNEPKLIVAKNGLCKFHNEERKRESKRPKTPKPKVINKKELRYGQCKLCQPNTISVLATKHLCRFHNIQKKEHEKSKRVVKLVNKAVKKKSISKLKEELDAVFSLFIRWRGSKDGINKCFTCDKPLPIKELQDGHYESRKHTSLRWDETNNQPQCYMCNIVKNGNYTVYALRMIEKYGKEHLDMLAIKKHNTVKWTAFEYRLMIDEYTEKLNKLKASL